MAIFFENLEVGELGTSSRSFDLTATETVAFAEQWDPQPFHIDEEVAKESIYGGLTASGCHLICISNILWKEIEGPAVMGLLSQTFKFPRPARPGDRLKLWASVVQKRESRSKPDRGIVLLRATLEDEEGVEILVEESTVMVAKGSHQA